jgi:enoyl-[acyl-carrier protein] reductase II
MKETKITQLLGIEYPIIQGALGFISGPELVAAVSNAGAIGTLSTKFVLQELRDEVRKTKDLTDKSFSVNIAVRPGVFGLDKLYQMVDLLGEEGVKVVTTAAGDPMVLTKMLKDRGMKVLHVAPTVKLARRAAEAGVDAIIAEGRESGGYVNYDDVATMVLVPLVVDAVRIPVIAAGGIADGRGLVAALALGAHGIQMGTLLKAQEDETMVVVPGKETGAPPMRSYKNPWAIKAEEIKLSGKSLEEMKAHIGYPGKVLKAMVSGDVEDGAPLIGEIAGMVQNTVTASQLIQNIVEEADSILKNIQRLI